MGGRVNDAERECGARAASVIALTNVGNARALKLLTSVHPVMNIMLSPSTISLPLKLIGTV